MKRSEKIRQAIADLADLFSYGQLQADSDPVGFLENVTADIKETRKALGNAYDRAERAERDVVELAKLAMEMCEDHDADHEAADCDFCGPWRERVAAIEDLHRGLDTSPVPSAEEPF